MSTSQRLTLIGLYNYDGTLFENLTLPVGYDKETFIDSLLLEHGEKCILYTSPNFMKNAIGAWSRKWELELTRIYEALIAEYNPIYNYDRYEEYKDIENKTGSGNSSNVDDRSTSTSSNTSTSINQNATNEHLRSAYDSSDYQKDNKDTSSGTSTTSGSDSSTVRDGLQSSGSFSNKDDRTLNHTAHLYGNIGVTTSATMVTEVVEQRIKYNLYEIATRLFANELLINIY